MVVALPPLSALRAFEAAARHGSLTAAASELNVTHAAIAQQVKRLEEWFGVSLLQRAGRGVSPTDRGAELANGLGEGFGAIRTAVERLTQQDEDRPLWITLTPTFAVHWLMPRVGSFRAKHPEIELMVNPSPDVIDLKKEDYDVAIRFGRPPWPGLESRRLVAAEYALVAAPSLLEHHKLNAPADLLGVPWVQEFGREEIRVWLASRGVEFKEHRNVMNVPGHIMLEAVKRGQGVGLTATEWVKEDVKNGALVILFADEEDPELGYHLVTRPAPHRPAVKAFLSWLNTELGS